MQKLSELLNITVTKGNPLTIYHSVFKDKEIYWECSTDYWDKREYDNDGNEIYYENSNGKIIDKRVTELTLDQIAEKFGISVNQLKIKK